MQGWVGVLPLLTAALAATIPLTPKGPWSTQDAVDFFNQRTNFAYLYKLEETGASGALTRPGRMQFTVKETECLKSETQSIEDCKFKEGGAMKNCTAFLPEDPKTDEIVISCDSPISKRTRLRRAPRRCRRAGCYSSIGAQAPASNKFESPSDVLREGFEGVKGIFDPVNEFQKTPGSSLSHERSPYVIASFRPVEEIDQKYEANLFGDSNQEEEEDFRIVKENRSPTRFRTRRAHPWTWDFYRRAGRFSIIGHERPNDDNRLEPLFPAPEPYLGDIASVDSDLDEKHLLHSRNIFTGDDTKSLESTNPFELGGAWHEPDVK